MRKDRQKACAACWLFVHSSNQLNTAVVARTRLVAEKQGGCGDKLECFRWVTDSSDSHRYLVMHLIVWEWWNAFCNVLCDHKFLLSCRQRCCGEVEIGGLCQRKQTWCKMLLSWLGNFMLNMYHKAPSFRGSATARAVGCWQCFREDPSDTCKGQPVNPQVPSFTTVVGGNQFVSNCGCPRSTSSSSQLKREVRVGLSKGCSKILTNGFP